MKKTLKIFASVLVLATIISIFCACEINFGGEDETTAAPIVVTDEPTKEGEKTNYTRPSETEPSSEASDKVEVDSLDTILNNIKDYPIGTSGSTTKGYLIAYKLLNFTQNSNFTANEAQQDYTNFISSLSESEKTAYFENLDEINYFAEATINDPSVLDSHLESYEPISADGTITKANYDALYAIISK